MKKVDEIENLRARLHDAEETLRALRSGEIDAIISAGRGRERVFTLEGADRPYRLMVETMSEGAVTLSPEAVILYSNRGFAELIKEDLTRVIGVPASKFVVPSDREKFERMVRRARTGAATEFISLAPADGLPIPTRITMHSLGADGPEGISAVLTDLTEVKKREMVTQKNEELENFARVLAHDLRSPIASLQVFAKAMAEELSLPTIDKDEVLDQCREIFAAAGRAGGLIDDLFTYTRAGAQLALETVDMNQTADNAVADLKKTIQERMAQVTREELPAVVGDSLQLTQLFQNLIANAIKFCKAGPPRVHIAARPNRDETWLISVKDNGIGIDPKDFTRLFHPFTRLNRTGEFEGTGLGLAICKKIIERHDGAIWCESAPGEGATFFFTLPGAAPQPR
jgi:PAS domain S-box-containing protein